jgi:DNA-binding LytR/AlgR family response regulator
VYVLRQTLGSFARALPAGFVRINRSLVINLARVRTVRRASGGRYGFTFADGTVVHSSRRYQRELRPLLRSP